MTETAFQTPERLLSSEPLPVPCATFASYGQNQAEISSLLDLLHFTTTTPNRVLRNDYKLRFDSDVLVDTKGTQLFNTFKLGTDVRVEDMSIINFFFLSFDKLPEPLGPRNIEVRLTSDEGIVQTLHTLLTFAEIN